MNSKFAILLLVFVMFNSLYAWEKEYTHPALSQESANYSQVTAYLRNQLGYTSGLDTQLHITNTTTLFVQDLIDRGMNQNLTSRSILEWTREGSKLEDAKVMQARSQHHFYDPIRNTGLNNRTDHPAWEGLPTIGSTFDLRGESALFWITAGTSSTGYPKNNQETWSETRNKFYSALSSFVSSNREQYMAETFIALGHILHMLEDMGVPAHTRNDFLFGHYRTAYKFDWGNPLETEAEKQVKANNGNIPSAWLTGWSPQPKALNMLVYYWDTGSDTTTYIGTPSTAWGLAEQTNYQFLSTSTVFGCNGTLYQFPNPAKSNTTLFSELRSGGEELFRYFQGYGVQHLVRESYTHYFADAHGVYDEVIDSTNTPDDNSVYNDYFNITIPRTIDYATGLLNYFFRGKLEIEPNCLDCSTITFKIRNISKNSDVEQTLKGGTFELFWDDRDGNRTKNNDFTIPGWTAGSELGYDQQITGTFNKPDSNEIETYTVVYKGQINENPAQPDDDDDEAIAVATLRVGYPIIAWGRDNEGQVSGVPEGNDFIDVAAGKYHGLAIRSNGALAAWGRNDYGQCNVPEGNDFIAIAGGIFQSIALRSNGSIAGFGDNTLGQIDVPEGNDYVAVACGDYHSLAITTQGLVVGWGGYNYYGECDAPEPNEGTIFVSVSAGRYHSLGLQSDGRIRAWGSNEMGQTRIYLGAGDDHEAIAAADTYNFLLLEDDMLVTWGGGDWLEPGMPDYHYRQPDEHDFVAIAAGGYHIVALTADGQIFCWDYDDFNYASYPVNPVPEGIVFTKDVAAGWKFSIALKAR